MIFPVGSLLVLKVGGKGERNLEKFLHKPVVLTHAGGRKKKIIFSQVLVVNFAF